MNSVAAISLLACPLAASRATRSSVCVRSGPAGRRPLIRPAREQRAATLEGPGHPVMLGESAIEGSERRFGRALRGGEKPAAPRRRRQRPYAARPLCKRLIVLEVRARLLEL